MAKASIEFAGFDELMNKFNRLDMKTKEVAEEALRKGHEIMTAKAQAATAHYPQGGHFSSGDTAKSLQTSPKITWNGTEASVPVGFDIKRGGLPSIFMMYGTPRYMKVQEMYDAFYSSQIEGEVLNAAKEIFMKALGELE